MTHSVPGTISRGNNTELKAIFSEDYALTR